MLQTLVCFVDKGCFLGYLTTLGHVGYVRNVKEDVKLLVSYERVNISNEVILGHVKIHSGIIL